MLLFNQNQPGFIVKYSLVTRADVSPVIVSSRSDHLVHVNQVLVDIMDDLLEI